MEVIRTGTDVAMVDLASRAPTGLNHSKQSQEFQSFQVGALDADDH